MRLRRIDSTKIAKTGILGLAMILTLAAVIAYVTAAQQTPTGGFGPQNPFYAASTLPFHAPPFDRIKDSDYQPAIEAGIAAQRKEFDTIGNDAAAPTFANTFVPLEKSGQLLERTLDTFFAVSNSNTDPELQRIEKSEAPKLAALEIFNRSKALCNGCRRSLIGGVSEKRAGGLVRTVALPYKRKFSPIVEMQGELLFVREYRTVAEMADAQRGHNRG